MLGGVHDGTKVFILALALRTVHPALVLHPMQMYSLLLGTGYGVPVAARSSQQQPLARNERTYTGKKKEMKRTRHACAVAHFHTHARRKVPQRLWLCVALVRAIGAR